MRFFWLNEKAKKPFNLENFKNMNEQLYNIVLQVWCLVLVFGKKLPKK